ncbi:hypothetical protein BZG36_02296 [Bifiguratus adelaidae]|uniref:Uncharacterized protein n=1 Tax=Bifiguratus adelaidae TaxID=1938954 RepID=A0A261Y3Q7_9FUNG|nr:hypothetical protein BZG36_02296 [Bifiguratus adelaidae]
MLSAVPEDVAAHTSNYSTASTLRTIKVLEEVNVELNRILNDISTTASQLQQAQASQAHHESQLALNVVSNKEIRAQIAELLEVLEQKDRDLAVARSNTTSVEATVKSLREEALSSRKTLENLLQVEKPLEDDKDRVDSLNTKAENEIAALDHSVTLLQQHYEREEIDMQQELHMQEKRYAAKLEEIHAIKHELMHQRDQLRQEAPVRLQELKQEQARMQAISLAEMQDLKSQVEAFCAQVENSSGQQLKLDSITALQQQVNGLDKKVRDAKAAAYSESH